VAKGLPVSALLLNECRSGRAECPSAYFASLRDVEDAVHGGPGGSEQRAVRRWIGLLLIALVAALWVFAFLFIQLGCGDDCGDQGGRGVFFLVTLATPCAALGAGLIVASARREIRDGHPPGRAWKLGVRGIRIALALGILAMVLLSVALLAMAVAALISPETSDREQRYFAAGAYTLFAALWSATARFVWRALYRVNQVLHDWG
jgi:hypothetical protein